ncbi:DNA primase family protein [Tundrisphaera sp. TA3]|uniref:DNA primase family protein n=1 Tax=Tundrisphaera sp. TA3 TaxID=3435775 RepID=UPI003EBA92EC
MSIGVYNESTPFAVGNLHDPKNALGLARSFSSTHQWIIRHHDGQWWAWEGRRFVVITQDRMVSEVYKWVESLGAFPPNDSVVKRVVKALAAITESPLGTTMPCWLAPGNNPDPESIIPFANGLFDIDSAKAIPHTPAWFSANCLPHPFDPWAQCPAWERFVDEVFEGDLERIHALSEWFGYNLTRDIRQQTFALLVGPPASGKSTTLRVLGDMLGHENVATPTLTTLWRFYGMETIHTKMAAIIGDAHLENRGKGIAILEKLKSVVGGDRQNIDLKGRQEIANVVVRARFTIAVNELPQFPDSANALRRRMLVIPFNRSFRGSEDRDLGDRLAAEMPGIVAWSMRGLERLRHSGTLTRPKAGNAILDDLDHLGSPIKEYLEDCCEIGPNLIIRSQTLWESWVEWCQAHGYKAGNSGQFGAMLKAAEPGIDRVRHGRDERGNQIRCYQGVTLRRLVRPTSV